MAIKQPTYGYKYKPTAVKLFKTPAKKKTTQEYLSGQVSNLEKRFEGVGVNPKQPKSDVDKRNLLEKALNLTQDQNMLMDILEVLDRPRQVVANVLSSMGSSDKRNILEAAWDGLAGREKLSTKKALQKLTGDSKFLEFQKDDKSILDEIGNFVVDVGLDIVSDPTTYLPMGAIIKGAGGAIAKGAGAVGGAAISAAKASSIKGVAAVANKVDDFARAAGKVIDKIGYAFDATKGLSDDNIRAIKKISGEAGQTADELKTAINDVANILRKSKVKNADRIAQEIIESQTELVLDASGKWLAKTPTGKLVMSDVMNQFLDAVKKRPTDALGKIAEKVLSGVNFNTGSTSARQTIKNIVSVANRYAGKTLFKLRVGKAGSVALQFLGTADEMADVIKHFKGIQNTSNNIVKTVVDFGERKLSQETLEAIAKQGDIFKQITDKARNVRDLTRKFLSQMDEFKIGDKVFKSNVEYMRRVPTAQAEEFFKQSKSYVTTPYAKPGTSDLVTRTYEGTTKEINAAMQDLYGATGDLFNESALVSLTDLVNVAQKQYTQTNFTKLFLGFEYDAVSKTYKPTANSPKFFMTIDATRKGEVSKLLPDGYKVLGQGSLKKEFSNLFKNLPDEIQKALDNDFLEALGANAGKDGVVAMQRSAYNIFKNVDNAYKEIPELIKYYDDLMTKWKTVSLLSPGFHGRNFFGNATNMYLSGMNTLDIIGYQAAAVRDLMRYKKLARLRAGGAVLNQADNLFLNSFDEISRSGILTGHRGARDLESVKEMVERLGQGRELKKKGILQKIIETNFNLAEEMDDIQRIAMYRWSAKKTGSTAAAFKQVREALFDYTMLTPFERDVMKRAVPFYTFMKNNIVFQAKNIVNNPNQYAKLLRGYKHWTEGMTDMDINELPDYMTQNMWLPIPTLIQRDDKDTINFLKLNLPPSDFAEFIENPFSKGVTSLTVPAKVAIELGTGRDSFTGAPLTEFPGQQNRMEKGTGLLEGLRGKDGEFYLSGDPVIQKIADDLGLRNPRKIITALLGIADTATGKQSIGSFADDFGDFLGMSEAKSLSEIQITSLYQKLEELRNLKKLYEQQTGGKLPTLKDLGERFGYKFKE